ncbi:PQQ-dependent sugar dehydrogenase [Goodfellowiella coeruleoviolacea]|uniref:PQQ-dependent sugar dehydrogenase n=1 Tax=Goodfellowiella coeruleoviolacea TaxID=334858 RepID=UPI0026465A9C
MPRLVSRRPGGLRALLAGSAVVGLLAAGCASFPEAAPQESWQSQPELTPETAPEPRLPGEAGRVQPSAGAGTTPSSSVPPPNGCTDYNPTVIATCLASVSAVATLPGSAGGGIGAVTALAAERTTGRILRVKKDTEPVVVATLAVDASGDGGLTGLVLSPTYAEDQLVYAYVTTATDNRVIRIAPGDTPKPILTGIPKGSSGNRGVLARGADGALLVATGDAGNPAAASNPASLAGKVLRINGSGKPAKGNPTADSAVVASGVHAPAGLCVSPDGGHAWLTDRGADRDLLYRLTVGQPLGEPAWSWPDRPGVGGCAALPSMVWITTSTKPGSQILMLNPDGTFNGKPVEAKDQENGLGRLGPLDLIDDNTAVVGTVNKDGGQPVSSDDRVAVIVRPDSAGSGID